MIKKIIGLVLIFFIFFFAVKAITFLPSINNLVIGPNKSPFQIGTDYIDQINKTYPYQNHGSLKTSPTKYSHNRKTSIFSKITLEKLNGRLILSIENANPSTNLNIWLTDTADITSKTAYIDFGLLHKDVSTRQYVVDMKGGDISLDQYNNVLIVDQNNQIYTKVILK